MQLTGSQWILYGVLGVVWAVMGYLLSENDRKRLGRTPWGLPSVVWAFFWLLSLLLGLALYLIAHSAEVRRARQNAADSAASPDGAPSPMKIGRTEKPSASDLFPAYPRPANAQPQQAEPRTQVPSSEQQVPTDAPASWPHSPPAWHPDPSGRFHYRWWDGRQWTSQVSTDGHHLIDTNPDQRIGPY
jgi:hypothetical protein